jgi:NAD(P)-dependent dehydrogenase (short-subunit alcohol dehydrogenase family)
MTGVALVTGAGSGIGRASALALLADGWRVALLGRNRDTLDETVSQSGAAEQTLVVPCDVADPTAVLDEWNTVISVNLNGAFLCARAAFAQMRKQAPQGDMPSQV